jgi:hypothetical protein
MLEWEEEELPVNWKSERKEEELVKGSWKL